MRARISVITLGVADLACALRFYRDGMGLATEGIVGQQYALGAVVFIDLQPGLKLALWPRASMAADAGLPVAAPSPTEVAIAQNVASEAEVDAVMAQAATAGAVIRKPAGPSFWGGYAGLFQDPDGHLWEIAYNPKWPLPAA